MAQKLSQRQLVAEIVTEVDSGNPTWNEFKFAQVSGGEITAAVEKVYAGGDKSPSVLCAPFEIGDITVTAHMDDATTEGADDGGQGVARKLAGMRSGVGSMYYDLSVYMLDCDIVAIGTDRVYKNALLVGITEPEGDASSGAPATFSLTFAVQNVISGLDALG
jgi:hypothetical protein